MLPTRTTTIRLIKLLGILILAGIIIAYAIWRSLNYTRGPVINIIEPLNGSSTASTTITIRGIVERVNNIYLNGNALSIDEQGHFSETIIVFPGLNKISLKARDQFGREVKTILDIVRI